MSSTPGAPGLPAAYSIGAVEATRAWLVPRSLVARHRGALALEPMPGYRGEMSLFLRHVGDLIKGPPVTCAPGITVAAVAQLMTRQRIGSVIVLGADGAPAGIVTDRDLRTRVVAPGLPAEHRGWPGHVESRRRRSAPARSPSTPCSR